MTRETVQLFLEELDQLLRKYKIKINGCGCCDSPYLDGLYDEELKENYGYSIYHTEYRDTFYTLKWLSEKGLY